MATVKDGSVTWTIYKFTSQEEVSSIINNSGVTNLGSISVTKSTQSNWSPPDEGIFYWANGAAKKISRMSVVTGVTAGSYSLKNLLQQLVNKSHTHSTRSVTVNCDCDCDCD